MKHFRFFCVALGFALVVLPVYAQQENEFKQLIQEFNFTTAVYPQEKKELQFTPAGFLLRSPQAHDLDLGFSVEYGLTDRLQVEGELVDLVVMPRNIDETGRSAYSLNTGMLYNLINGPGLSASLALELEFPVQKTDDTISLEYEPHFILARQMGKGQLHVDIGGELQAKEKEYFYNLAFVYPVGDLKPVLELNGSYQDHPDLFVSPGLVWNNGGKLEVVTGTTFGVWLKGNPWGVSLKLVYEFSLGKERDN